MKSKSRTFHSKDPHQIIEKLKGIKRTVKICCLYSIPSICALQILTEVLKKEMIEYEVGVSRYLKINTFYDIYIDMDCSNITDEYSGDDEDHLMLIFGKFASKKLKNDEFSNDSDETFDKFDCINSSEDSEKYLMKRRKSDNGENEFNDSDQSIENNKELPLIKISKDNSAILDSVDVKTKDDIDKENVDINIKDIDPDKEHEKILDIKGLNYSIMEIDKGINNKFFNEIDYLNKENIPEKNKKVTDQDFINTLKKSKKYNKIFRKEKKILSHENIFVKTSFEVQDNLKSIFTLYEMAKNLNYITNTILWPISIILTNYLREKMWSKEDIVSENSDSDEFDAYNQPNKDFYREIPLFIDELSYQIKKQNTGRLDGIFKKKNFYFPFLNNSTLFDCLSCDFSMLSKYKKLNKNKIFERLAKVGISIREANENFNCISAQTKKQIEKCMDKKLTLVKKSGYSGNITAQESYYVMLYYLSIREPIKALLSITDKITDIHLKYGKEIYQKIMEIVKLYNHKIKKIKNIGIVFVPIKCVNGYKNPEIVLKAIYDVYMEIHKEINIVLLCERFQDNLFCIICDQCVPGEEIYDNCFLVEKRAVKNCIDILLD